MKKILSLLLAFSFAADAQTVKGGMTEMPVDDKAGAVLGSDMTGGMGGLGGSTFIPPRTSSGNSLVLPQVDLDSRLCSFGMGDEVSQDDRLLLTNARSLADSLRSNSEQCRQATQQNFDAFNTSVQDFNNFNDSSRPLNPDSPVQANCSNYERFYDIQYDQFVNTWESEGVRDIFATCRRQPREQAFTCAQELISNARIEKRNTCEMSREFISSQRSTQLQVDTLKTGVDALTAIINSDQCMGEDPNQRMNLVQSAVSLASRAASLSLVGSPLALGIGAVTGLLQSAIGRLFRKGSRDPYQADQNQQNFEKVACLYEQVEARARRCDRDAAEQFVIREQGRFNSATQACEAIGDVEAPVSLIRDLSTAIGEMAPAPQRTAAEATAQPAAPARPTTPFSQTFNTLMDRLLQETPHFGGQNETPLSVGIQSAQDVINNIDLMLAPESTNLDSYLQAKSGSQTAISNPMRNRERSRLREEKARAESVKNLLTLMKEVGDSPNQSDADLERVQTAMRQFTGGQLNGNALNFAGAFNQVLAMRGELTDDLGNRINTWKSRLSQYQLNRDVINRYNQNVSRRNASFNDNGSFQSQVDILRPYLKDQMESELTRLNRNAQAVVQDTSRENVTNSRATTAENILWPMVRACNLLQSVNAENNACAKISCGDGSGVKTFAQYLSQGNRNQDCRAQSCPAEYNTFICQNKGPGVTAAIGARLKNEYVSNGTICGRPWNEVFGSRR